MRSKLFAALLVLAFSPASGASDEEELLHPRCGGPFQLCGYIDKASETQRIPFRFEVANMFDEGVAPVRIDGRYGYIDRTGQVVIAPQFQAAGPFEGGYAEVRVEGKSGII